MIIITSSVPIRYWYKELRFAGETESLLQFYRRVSCYVDVKEKEVFVYNSLNEFGVPVGLPLCYKNDVVLLKQQKEKERFDFSLIFDKFCERSEPCNPRIELISIDDEIF